MQLFGGEERRRERAAGAAALLSLLLVLSLLYFSVSSPFSLFPSLSLSLSLDGRLTRVVAQQSEVVRYTHRVLACVR